MVCRSFKSEAFDTFGKILPRAQAIAKQISLIYLGLTIACMVVYLALGMVFLMRLCMPCHHVDGGIFQL